MNASTNFFHRSEVVRLAVLLLRFILLLAEEVEFGAEIERFNDLLVGEKCSTTRHLCQIITLFKVGEWWDEICVAYSLRNFRPLVNLH